MLQTKLVSDEERYREQRRKTKCIYIRNKRNYQLRMLEQLEHKDKRHEIKKFYQGIKKA